MICLVLPCSRYCYYYYYSYSYCYQSVPVILSSGLTLSRITSAVRGRGVPQPTPAPPTQTAPSTRPRIQAASSSLKARDTRHIVVTHAISIFTFIPDICCCRSSGLLPSQPGHVGERFGVTDHCHPDRVLAGVPGTTRLRRGFLQQLCGPKMLFKGLDKRTKLG